MGRVIICNYVLFVSLNIFLLINVNDFDNE